MLWRISNMFSQFHFDNRTSNSWRKYFFPSRYVQRFEWDLEHFAILWVIYWPGVLFTHDIECFQNPWYNLEILITTAWFPVSHNDITFNEIIVSELLFWFYVPFHLLVEDSISVKFNQICHFPWTFRCVSCCVTSRVRRLWLCGQNTQRTSPKHSHLK